MRVILGILMLVFACNALAEDGIGIAAVVDDKVVSSIDLNDRMALVMGTTNIPDTPENRARLAPQILHQLIDEKLQMEEAARDGVSITDAKLREGIAQIEKQNGKEPGSLDQFISDRGLSRLSMYEQVRAQMAWAEVVRKKIRPRVKISDLEVARYTKRKAPSMPAPVPSAPLVRIKEVLISVIHIPVDSPQREASVRKLAEKLSAEIRKGASFAGVASQFSSSATGTKTTTPFWVEMSQIDPAIAHALVSVPKGGVSDPVRTPTGYQIIKLVDLRQAHDKNAAPAAAPAAEPAPAAEDGPRAELAFKQILMALKPDAKVKEAELLLGLAKEVQQSPGRCDDKSMAGAGDLSDMDFRVTLTRAVSSDLPEKMRDLLMQMKVGAASDPIVTPQGIRVFMLCERMDLPTTAKISGPEHDAEAHQAIYMEKLELEAQKYLRDLRREAFIEIRNPQ